MRPAGGAAGERHRPRRTCVGCRATTTADELLRLALPGSAPSGSAPPGTALPGTAPSVPAPDLPAPEGGGSTPAVVPDVRRRLGGRGAWLHPDPACLALAVRRRALPRALRVPPPVDVSAVEALLAPRGDAG
ncbi:YlxR family protein [uncultured Pseudokineococcus sp.]|uniref:YlxR family protein n=1 Tax=uncultured Pseudokineococcus sp. TaxID=1642928 RepID=UPI00263848C0|nr:YlxR family protein [uncultured Pseudokineococcus sp.]